MTTSSNKPADTLRDGRITAKIWKNAGQKGVRYSVVISRFYQDQNGNYRDSDTFSNGELLRVARLAHKAYDRIAELRAEDNANTGGSQ